jgi:hypothetical protein
LGSIVLYLRDVIVAVPLLLFGTPRLESKGAAVLAPETPKTWQSVATDAEFNPKVTLSANSVVPAIA